MMQIEHLQKDMRVNWKTYGTHIVKSWIITLFGNIIVELRDLNGYKWHTTIDRLEQI